MIKMPLEDFLPLIEAGHETRNTEFKSPFTWGEDKALWLQEKVIKAVLGFSNTKDGGNIVIGITEEVNSSPQLVGLSKDKIRSFSYDDIKGQIDSFGSSAISFMIKEAEYNDKCFIVMQVGEFEELPIICKKDSQTKDIMRRGDIYCRLLSGNISTDKATEKEMREIVEMAIDKGNRKLRKRGYILKQEQKVEDFFAQQIKDLK